MSAEHRDFTKFLALETDAERYGAFAQLLLRNQNNFPEKGKKWVQAWTKEDAHIVIGLASHPSPTYPTRSLLDDYLDHVLVRQELRDASGRTVQLLVNHLTILVRTDANNSDMIAELRSTHGYPLTTFSRSYLTYLVKDEKERKRILADIINRNVGKKSHARDWNQEDAAIIVGLGTDFSQDDAEEDDLFHTPRLETYLLDPQIPRVQQLFPLGQLDLAKMQRMVEHLQKHHFPESAASTHSINTTTSGSYAPFHNRPNYCGVIFTSIGHSLWKERNYGQRVAMVGLIPSAITSAVLGAIISQSATLTTAGTTMAKFLPGFVASFGITHAIPPAALAFYTLAATFAAAALVLLLASSLYRCATKERPSTHPHSMLSTG